MRVQIEHLPMIELKDSGAKIRIRTESGGNLGKLWFGQANLRWARGSISEKNAKTIPVQDLVDWLNSYGIVARASRGPLG